MSSTPNTSPDAGFNASYDASSPAVINAPSNLYQMTIGLEIHAQIAANSKLFSPAAAGFNQAANEQVDFIDAGFPGMLPRHINTRCVHLAIKTGLSLNATINSTSIFDRKHYIYQDLPKGYQCTQFYYPIVQNGYVNIKDSSSKESLSPEQNKRIRINRIHLEDDAGQSLHDLSATHSHINLNRAGAGLMEIVTEPDFENAEQVTEFLKQLRLTLIYLGACDGNMEEGNFRVDVNLSVSKTSELGTRCELKNLNSFRFIKAAIEYEKNRQIALLESGEKVIQQTRLFDTKSGTTKAMRDKENATDYRYFPDPDILPLVITQDEVNKIRATLPELPFIRYLRYTSIYGISIADSNTIINNPLVSNYFDEARSFLADSNKPQMLVNLLIGEMFNLINKQDLSFAEQPVTAQHLAELVNMIELEVISSKMAKALLEMMFANPQLSPQELAHQHNLVMISDENKIRDIINTTLLNLPNDLKEYREGKVKLFGFFVGAVMKQSEGKVEPNKLNRILKEILDAS